MPALPSLAGVSRIFLLNNGVFLVTGWFMILGNQQLGYWQANSPYSFLAGVAQYAGMLLLGLAWMVADWKLLGGPKPLSRGLHLRLLLPVAIPDLCDTFFAIFGILNLGSGLFIIIFSFVTVLAALIRWAFLRKKLHWWQWGAIVAITAVLVATAGSPSSAGDGRALGIICTLVATLMDAVMYVCAEHALNPKKGSGAAGSLSTRLSGSAREPGDGPEEEEEEDEGVTPAEIVTIVGLINLPAVLLYIIGFSLSGHWSEYVAEPIARNGCGGTAWSVFWLWALQAFMYWAHYLSFYWVAKQGSAVAAGVNKAIQGTTIFTLSHLFFCPSGPAWLMRPTEEAGSTLIEDGVMCTEQKLTEQCFDASKGIAVAVVAVASLVYSAPAHPSHAAEYEPVRGSE